MERKFSSPALFILSVMTTLSLQVSGQTLTEKELKNVISGTGTHGGYGLFMLPSADVLPVGKFVMGGIYETVIENLRSKDVKYSLGIGLSKWSECFASFTNVQETGNNELVQLGIKINFLRGELRKDFLGSIEVGHIQREIDNNGLQQSNEAFLSRVHSSVLLGGIEILGSVGYAVRSKGQKYADRIFWGAGAFLPLYSNLTFGAEIGVDLTSPSSDRIIAAAGVKGALFDHFQVMVITSGFSGAKNFSPSIALGLSLSSAVFHITPGRQKNVSNVPLLPTLNDLRRQEGKNQ